MKIRGHGNAVAISLAALAVVIAGTGTAFAVATTTVNIADPTSPTHIAHVDSSGRLTTIGATASINSVQYVPPTVTLVPLTGATTGSLAITRIGYTNPSYNLNESDTNFQITISKYNVGASGSCTGTDASFSAVITRQATSANTTSETPFAIPLVVKATGSTPYCLVAQSSVSGSLPTGGYFYPIVQLTGYVASGTYTGIGSSATPTALTGRAASPGAAR